MSEEEKEAIWYCSEILADNENDIEHWKIVEKLIDKLQKRINEYEELFSALEDYYTITIEDIKKCIKEDI